MNTDQDTNKQKQKPLALCPFQLVDIRLYEIRAEHCDPDQEGQTKLPLSVSLHSGNEPPEAESFGLLLTFETSFLASDDPGCNIFLAIEGQFQAIVDVSTIKPEVIQRFKSVDAIVLFWPYLRQMLHDITNRMRLAVPPLPIIDPRALVESMSAEKVEET